MTPSNYPLPQQPQTDTEGSDLLNEFDLSKFLFVLRKSIGWIFLIFLTTVAGAFLFLRYSKPVYQASSLLKLEFKSSTSLLNLNLGQFNEGIDAINLAGEIELIRSRLIYQGVIDSLRLQVSYFLEGDILDDERFGNAPFEVSYQMTSGYYADRKVRVVLNSPNTYDLVYEQDGKPITKTHEFDRPVSLDGLIVRLRKTNSFSVPESYGKYHFIIHSEPTLYTYLSQNLTVQVENPQANTLRISFRDNSRSKAIAIVDAINRNYLVQTLVNKNRVFEQSLEYLDKQLRMTRDSLDRYERMLQALTQQTPRLPETRVLENTIDQLKGIEEQKISLLMQMENYHKLVEYLERDSSAIYLSTISAMIGNGTISNLVGQYMERADELTRITGYYKEATFSRRQKEDEMRKLRRDMMEAIQFNQMLLEQRLDALNKKNRELQASLFNSGEENSELKKLNKNYSIYDNIANIIFNKIIEINIAKSGTVPNFQILAPASAPEKPIYPVPPLVYAVGGGAGVFLSLAFVLIGYLMQNRINALKDLEKVLKAPILGIVPRYEKTDMDFSQLVIHRNPKSSISEAFRSIRTNLDFMASSAEQGRRVISVTSTISGEGKTFIAVNLAGVIALSGARVVILDLDMRKPKIHLAFGVENTIGMSSVLIGKSTIQEALHDTRIPTLKFIMAGSIPPNPAELILSNRFDALLDDLKKEFDVIVLDTPPVGLVTDGIIAMRRASLPIYVVRAGYSRINFAHNINAMTNANKFGNLSVVLNYVDSGSRYGYSSSGYGYGYSYGYGYGYGGYGDGGYYEEERSKKPKKWWHRLPFLRQK